MSTIKISQLPAAPSSIAGNSLIPIVQNGVTQKATVDQLAPFFYPFVNVKEFGAIGNGVADDTAAINAALAAANEIYFPPGVYMTSGGHNIQGKSLLGFNRDASIIKAIGTNSGVTIFTGAIASPSNAGTFGAGGAFRLENLGIYGNWDGTSGLTLVGSYNTGVLAANYNATLNSALVKGTSTVYTFIKDCQFAFAYEHAVMFYGNGYSEIDGNIFTTCRGSALWFAGDKSNPPTSVDKSTSTSTVVEDNQITTCRGGNGAMVMFLTYGYTVRGNLFEANVYGYALYEGADCSFVGNYAELGYIVGNNVGIAPVYIDPAVWGYYFIGEAYNPRANYLPAAPRSAVAMDRSGIRIAGAPGYDGAGIQFPVAEAASLDPNTLDDYQEGTFVPQGNNITFSAATGRYTKIGNIVSVTFSVTFPAGPLSDNCLIGGMPFSAANNVGVTIGNSGDRTPIDFYMEIEAGNAYVGVVKADNSAFLLNNDFAGKTLVGTVVYPVFF